MTTPPAPVPVQWTPPAGPRAPTAVLVAALATWLTALPTAAFGVVLWWWIVVLDELWSAFDEAPGEVSLQGAAVAGASGVLLGSLTASVVAIFLVRGRVWARYVLAVLAVVAVLGGLAAAYYVWPLLVAVAGGTVLVLLLTPSARAWPRVRAAGTASTPA